jgi:hypothetical protein
MISRRSNQCAWPQIQPARIDVILGWFDCTHNATLFGDRQYGFHINIWRQFTCNATRRIFFHLFRVELLVYMASSVQDSGYFYSWVLG